MAAFSPHKNLADRPIAHALPRFSAQPRASHEGWRLAPNVRPSLSERGRAAADRPEIQAAGRSARLNPLSEVSLSVLIHDCRSGEQLFGDFLAKPPGPRSIVRARVPQIGCRKPPHAPGLTQDGWQERGEFDATGSNLFAIGAHRPSARQTLPGTPSLTRAGHVFCPGKKQSDLSTRTLGATAALLAAPAASFPTETSLLAFSRCRLALVCSLWRCSTLKLAL